MSTTTGARPGTGRAGAPAADDDERGVLLRGLRKTYGSTPAVRDVDLDIPPGRVTAVLGGSGCGKTTVLRLVAGLEHPDDGTVRIDGRDVTALPPARRGVAMVFQDDALYPSKTVAGNIAFPLLMAGVGRARRRVLVQDAATRVRLESELRRRPHQLSGGQRQRVGIARALVREPAVLLLDEPLSHLDAALRQDLRREIAALQRRSATTMLYVTHDQSEAMAIADILVVMRDGTVDQVGPPRQVFDRPASTHVASFLGGMNLVRPHGAHGGRLVRGVRAEHLGLAPAEADHPVEPGGLDLRGEVESDELLGPERLVLVRCGPHRLRVRVDSAAPVPARVRVTAPPARVHHFDTTTGGRLDD